MEEDKQKAQRMVGLRHAHGKFLRKQVRKKEEGKISARKAFFEEGVRLNQEARERYAWVATGGMYSYIISCE
jgi:hypothetical protein